MKKSVILTIFALVLNVMLFGQNASVKGVKLHSLDLSTGRGALSTGFSFDLNIKGQKTFTQITLRQDRVMVNHFFSLLKGKVMAGPSAGYFQNVPFAGAIGKTSLTKHFSTLHWVGYSFGQPNGEIAVQPSFLFLVNSANVNIGRVKAYYMLISFMKMEPRHVMGVCYKQPLDNNWSVYTDVAYDLTKQEQLLKIGINYKL